MTFTRKQIALLFITFIAAIGIYIYFYNLTNNNIVIKYNKGYEPTQPLPFSHKLHAGKHKISCNFCHTNVQSARFATVPSLNICMNCHLTIKTDSPYIQKLAEHYKKKKPIEWQKVHLLPDHVKFNHAAHISRLETQSGKKGNTSCKLCHGAVEEMNTLYQWASLSMGWCINCHRQEEYKASIECSTCHY